MTYSELSDLLTNTRLFTDAEIYKIVRTCGKYTVGHDIDIIIANKK